MTEAKKRVNKWNIAIVALITIILGVLICRVGGLSFLCVMSGSMEPAIPTGSLIVVAPTDQEELHAGDVITFQNTAGTVITHRIDEVEQYADLNSDVILSYRTKGDANSSVDMMPINFQAIIGKTVLCIPGLGYVVNFLSSPVGLLLMFAVFFFLFSFKGLVKALSTSFSKCKGA